VPTPEPEPQPEPQPEPEPEPRPIDPELAAALAPLDDPALDAEFEREIRETLSAADPDEFDESDFAPAPAAPSPAFPAPAPSYFPLKFNNLDPNP